MRRLTLMGRFATTALVVVTLVGVLFALDSRHEIRDREFRAARESAELLIGLGVLPRLGENSLGPEDLGAGGRADAAVARVLDEVLAGRDEVVTIVGGDGVPRLTSGITEDELPASMLASNAGRPVLDVTEGPTGSGWLHVRVPLRSGDGPAVGDAIVSSPLAPVLGAIREQVTREVLLLVAGLAVLFGLLYRSVAAVSRTLREQARERDHAATHDDLTGLPNRVLLTERTRRALHRRRRTGAHRTALLLLDLDQFKEINDVLGHPAGDQLLRQVASRLRDEVPDAATLARLGGDEFAVLLPGVVDLAEAAGVAARLVRALDEPFELDSIEVSVGASVGISSAPGDATDDTELLAHADAAMYVAKRASLEVATYAHDVEDEGDIDRLRLLGGLRRAIEEGQLVLHYQPQVELVTGRIVGVEALVRWQHPTRGLLPPGAFIPLAEQSGLMGSLTSWVLETALAQQAAWQDEGIRVAMAVNVPPRTLAESGFAGRIFTSLTRWGVAPDRLELEITEDSIVAEGPHVTAALDRLRRVGVRIAIDDFGTGYSSLSYLTALPVDVLKIDRTLVRSLVEHDGQTAVLEAVTRLGHDLGLVIVAEGVEDDMSLSALRSLGIDLAQGYGLGRPAPADDVTDLLRGRLDGRREPVPADATPRTAGADHGQGRDDVVPPPPSRPERRGLAPRRDAGQPGW